MAANYALPDCIMCRIIEFLQPGVLPQKKVSSVWCFAARRVLGPAMRVLWGNFQVDCLELERFVAMDNFNIRLNRLLRIYGYTNPCPTVIFWYRCQLALSIAVRRQVLNLGDLLKQIVTYECRHEGYENSVYICARIKSHINQRLIVNETRWNTRLELRKYTNLGFAQARDLSSCDNLAILSTRY